MSVQTKYQIKKDGKWLGPDGLPAPADSENIAIFTSVGDAEFFLEASGSIGEYSIQSITIKS